MHTPRWRGVVALVVLAGLTAPLAGCAWLTEDGYDDGSCSASNPCDDEPSHREHNAGQRRRGGPNEIR